MAKFGRVAGCAYDCKVRRGKERSGCCFSCHFRKPNIFSFVVLDRDRKGLDSWWRVVDVGLGMPRRNGVAG